MRAENREGDHQKKRLRLQPHMRWADKLTALYQGKLSDTERASVEAHLQECQACRQAYLVYRDVAGILHGAPKLEVSLELPPRLQELEKTLLARQASAQPAHEPVDPSGVTLRDVAIAQHPITHLAPGEHPSEPPAQESLSTAPDPSTPPEHEPPAALTQQRVAGQTSRYAPGPYARPPHNTLRQKYPPGVRLPFAAVLWYVQQIAAALQYAHNQGIVYLDLKPENILLSERGTVMLAGFGLARSYLETPQHATSGFAGTPAYAAPEQFQEGQAPGPASDQYALAVMAYEWLTGTLPFAGDWFAIAHQKLTQEPPPLREKVPTISPAVEEVVLKALARDPRARFPSVQEFAAWLERVNPEPVMMHYPLGRSRGIYRGHRGTLSALAWSLTGSHLASAGSEETQVHVWEIKTKKFHQVYSGHTGVVRTIAWSPNGHDIASAGDDETVQVWNAWTGTHLLTYKDHRSTVRSIAWSPNGKYLASAGLDRTIRVWEVSRGTPRTVHTWSVSSSVYALGWSRDGKYIASGEYAGEVRVWEMRTGAPFTSYRRHKGPVFALAWSPDNRHLAFGGKETTIRIWDTTSREAPDRFTGHTAPISALAWSHDGRAIASGDDKGMVKVWDARTQALILTREGHLSRIEALAWLLPEGQQLGSGDNNGVVNDEIALPW